MPVTFGEGVFDSEKPALAQELYDTLVGLRVKKAQKHIVELLKQPDYSADGLQPALVGDPEEIVHPVKFFEKGTPLLS